MPNDLFAVALTAIRTDSSAIDRIAMNMANVLTPGFRRMRAPGTEFATLMAPDGEGTAAQSGPSMRVDNRNGPVRMTGRSLDVALTGPGYLEVMTPTGPAHTRHGALRIDSSGVLVTPGGHAVMGRDGAEVRVAATSIRIASDGAIFDATADGSGTPIAHLRIVNVAQGNGPLAHLGEGLYRAGHSPGAFRADLSTRVQQGALEASNVQAAEEMTDLVRTARHAEGVLRGVQTFDSMLGMAIRTLGEVR